VKNWKLEIAVFEYDRFVDWTDASHMLHTSDPPLHAVIGGFNQRQGEALPPQIFLTLKFVVCTALKIIEIVAT